MEKNIKHPINFRSPIRNLKEIATDLVSVDSFFGVNDDQKRISELLDGGVFFRGRLISMESWESPGNLEEGLMGGWKFFYHSLAWLVPLRRCASLDENYQNIYIKLLRDWLREHGTPPSPLPTQKNPGDYTWYDMSTAWRAMIIIGAISLIGEDEVFFAHLETHADVLANEEFYAKVGNHALHQNFALLSASIVLNRGDYLDLSLVRLEKLRAISIDDEGVSLEGSVGYHLFNIDWWLSMSAQLKVIDGLIENSISIDIPDMRPFLHYSIAPDGKIVPLGDSILSRGPYRNVINEYHDDFIKYIESDPNLLYVISCGQSGDPLPETMRVFSDGFWFSRGNRFDVSPRLHSHASLKFGPGLADRVHVHDDAGSITFYPNGVRLIDDSCLYGYYGGDKREFVKSNRAHNVIVVENRKYYRSAVSVLDFSNSSSDFDQAEVNILSVEKTRWTRIVFHAYNNGLLYVQDHVVTNGAPFQQIFNLGDDFRVVRILPGRVEVQNSKGVRAIILWLEKNTSVGYYFGSESPLMGWRSTYEGEIHPISCVSANFSEVGEGEVKKIGAVILMLEPDDEFSGVYIESVELRKKTSKFVIKKSSKKMEIVVGFGGESFRSKILVD